MPTPFLPQRRNFLRGLFVAPLAGLTAGCMKVMDTLGVKPTYKACAKCDGKGYTSDTCLWCKGTGETNLGSLTGQQGPQTCGSCKGTGQSKVNCFTCGGRGKY